MRQSLIFVIHTLASIAVVVAFFTSTAFAQLPIRFTVDGDSSLDVLGFSVSGVGDVNGDGFDDIIAGAPSDDNTGLNSGSVCVFSVCGQQLYGLGIDPVQTLVFEWRPFSSGPDAANGELVVDGAAPFSPGVFALSTQPTMTSLLGFTLLVDITASNCSRSLQMTPLRSRNVTPLETAS